MFAPPANGVLAFDALTLFVTAASVTALLGLFLVFSWFQERITALAWWGAAYLIGGLSVAAWSLEDALSLPLPAGTANALLFISCGMIWNAARLFHGRDVLWGTMFLGATLWWAACLSPAFLEWPLGRIVLSSLIVSAYTVLTAAELGRERRKALLRRWPAIFVPLLHGAVFLLPIPLARVLPTDHGVVSLASGWVAVFVLEAMLYVVGTAFILLVLTKEQAVNVHKNAANTDELTGVFNRRGFLAAAQKLSTQQARIGQPISVLLFDLDHFKSINDRFGHDVGDEALRLFAATASGAMRASDLVGRWGGEEFAAALPGSLADAKIAAERVRQAFEAAGLVVAGHELAATVSIGAASGAPGTNVAALLSSADSALYRAKHGGRNRVEGVEHVPAAAAPLLPERKAQFRPIAAAAVTS